MGHPEVYVILIPALAALLELTPVFARKPLFSFTAAVVGIVGVSVLGMMVWAHHMYASGWAPALNGPFMLTTEIISVPTGALILVFLGTLCGARSGLVSTSPSSACSPLGWPVSRAAWRRTQRCSAKETWCRRWGLLDRDRHAGDALHRGELLAARSGGARQRPITSDLAVIRLPAT